jgi:3-hydroxyacyl-CoA dehydrogenase
MPRTVWTPCAFGSRQFSQIWRDLLGPLCGVMYQAGMQLGRPIRRIAIVGAGAIGASWATLFLACGFNVIATDQSSGARISLQAKINSARQDLARMGLPLETAIELLEFTPDLEQALWDADFIQESGAEKPEGKIRLFAEMDAAAPANTVIASSSFPLTTSKVLSASRHPERCVIGHPSDLPHITSVVEVVGGAETSLVAIRQTMSLYASLGKTPIHLRTEHGEGQDLP